MEPVDEKDTSSLTTMIGEEDTRLAVQRLPSEFFCPITHSLMRDPVKAADGFTYDRLAITRWFAQRVTSPLTGETLSSAVLVPQKQLRAEIAKAAEQRTDTEEGSSYFACPFCGEAQCVSRSACRAKYERQLRADAAYGAAARRRRWIEGNVLPSAERALRSGPVGAGALMLGAFSVGAVGAVVGGAASAVAEVASGGAEICRGIADAAARAAARDVEQNDTTLDAQRPSWSRGCFKIASGAVLVPLASASIAAMFALGAAAGSVALATGILKEIGSSLITGLRLTANAIAGNSLLLEQGNNTNLSGAASSEPVATPVL